MQSPEAWNFQLSRPQMSVQHNEGHEALNELLHSQQESLVVTKANIFLPDTAIVPQELIQEFSQETEFYFTQEFKPELIFTRGFIANFVFNGRTLLVPSQPKPPLGTSFYIFPTNMAVIVFPKEKLDSLGISFGTILKETRGDFAVLAWKLQDLARKPNQLRKVELLFTQGQLQLFNRDYKFAWRPNQDDICPSSVAKYFHENGCAIEECSLEHSFKRLTNKSVPNWLTGQSQVEDVIMLENWLGAALLDVDPALCDIPGEKLLPCDSSLIVNLDGLMEFSAVSTLFQSLRDHMKVGRLAFVVVVLSCHLPLPKLEQASKGKKSSRPNALRKNHLTIVLHANGDFSFATTCGE